MELLKDRLKFLYTSQKLTQKQFAELIGIGQSTFNNYLTGLAEPNFKQLTILLKSMRHLNAEWLMIGEGEPFKNEIQNIEYIEKTNQNNDFHIKEDTPQYQAKKEAKGIDEVEILKKAVELLQLEMYNVKQELEMLKKKK